MTHLAVLGALALALSVGGCGRKGALDPPAAGGAAPVAMPAPGPGGLLPDSSAPATPAPPPPNKPFLLDGLLN